MSPILKILLALIIVALIAVLIWYFVFYKRKTTPIFSPDSKKHDSAPETKPSYTKTTTPPVTHNDVIPVEKHVTKSTTHKDIKPIVVVPEIPTGHKTIVSPVVKKVPNPPADGKCLQHMYPMMLHSEKYIIDNNKTESNACAFECSKNKDCDMFTYNYGNRDCIFYSYADPMYDISLMIPNAGCVTCTSGMTL
jgi:hypothetical protein